MLFIQGQEATPGRSEITFEEIVPGEGTSFGTPEQKVPTENWSNLPVCYPSKIEFPPDENESGEVENAFQTPLPRKHAYEEDSSTDEMDFGAERRSKEDTKLGPPPLKARRRKERYPQFRVMLPEATFKSENIPSIVLEDITRSQFTPAVLGKSQPRFGCPATHFTSENDTTCVDNSLAIIPYNPTLGGPRTLFSGHDTNSSDEELNFEMKTENLTVDNMSVDNMEDIVKRNSTDMPSVMEIE